MRLIFLKESGVAGHIPHIYEDKNLSFGEIINIISLACYGKLENTTEKIDGVNLFISWNFNQSELRVARNKTEIEFGGLSKNTLINRYNVLQFIFSSLEKDKLEEIFENKNVWISIEIVYKNNVNVIDYNTNAIIFHTIGIKYNCICVIINDIYIVFINNFY